MLAFDTLKYTKRLREAGVPEAQAEVQAETLNEIIESDLATKQDLRETESRLKLEIEQSKSSLELKTEQSKNDLIKWIVGIGLSLLLAQVTIALVLVRFFVP